jgi:hypothetical protein
MLARATSARSIRLKFLLLSQLALFCRSAVLPTPTFADADPGGGEQAGAQGRAGSYRIEFAAIFRLGSFCRSAKRPAGAPTFAPALKSSAFRAWLRSAKTQSRLAACRRHAGDARCRQ